LGKKRSYISRICRTHAPQQTAPLFDHLVSEPARPRNGHADEERYKLEPAAHIRKSFNRERNRSSAAAKVFLSLHFLFQDFTQYQERYWPNTDPNSQSLCVGFLQSRS